MSKLSENNTSRLASLDILRGFDLFLLVFFQPVFAALARQLNLPFLNDILYQFDHEVWEGFRFWDQALRCRFHCQSTSVCPAVTGPSIGGF